MSYDNWKTTPDDERRIITMYGETPCNQKPRYDDNDVCLYCGADPTQACQFNKENQTMSLADKLRASAKQPEDFAPPKVRETQQLASLEKEIAAAAPEARRSMGSDAMTKVTSLLKNSVTTAHDDTCAAVERVLADAGKMMDRLTMAVHDHNTKLREDGQRIAHQLEAALQALTNAVTWVEDHTPRLIDPKVDRSAPEVTDSKLLLQEKKPEEPKNGKTKSKPAEPSEQSS